VVNYAERPVAGRVHLHWEHIAGRQWRFDDLLSHDEFVRDGDELAASGLYVQLPSWG